MRGYNMIHAVANCNDCQWQDYSYHTAQRKGREHAKKTGHEVTIEVGYYIRYKRRI